MKSYEPDDDYDYDTYGEYVRDKLSGTYALYEGRLCTIVEIEHPDEIYLKSCDGHSIPHGVPLAAIDISPLKLGYINMDKSCHYAYRVPTRHDYRQGNRTNNMRLADSRFDIREVQPHFFCQPVYNLYPTLSEAIEQLNNEELGMRSRAWNRRWALRKNSDTGVIGVRYRFLSEDVGTLLDDGTISLSDGYHYLQEDLDEALAENNRRERQ